MSGGSFEKVTCGEITHGEMITIEALGGRDFFSNGKAVAIDKEKKVVYFEWEDKKSYPEPFFHTFKDLGIGEDTEFDNEFNTIDVKAKAKEIKVILKKAKEVMRMTLMRREMPTLPRPVVPRPIRRQERVYPKQQMLQAFQLLWKCRGQGH